MAPRRCVTALQNAVKSSLAKPQCRTFSRSAICGQNGGKSIAPFVCLCSQECGLGDLIDLQESSSPDLADLLQTIRSKIIIPNRLNKNQRRLIERKDYADNLENEPVHATVGGQRVRLQHLDKLKDVPARWESIKSAIELSQSKQDYENLFHLLRDMHSAGIPMKPFWQAKLTRNTQASGMLPVLMTGLRGVKETRLSLANPEVLHRTLWAIHAWAEDGKWKEEPIRVALHYAEEVIAMLEDPLHGGSPRLAENDPRTDPTITGVVLECAALLAHHHQGGKDESGKVALYAERVMSMFRSVGDEKVVDVSPDDAAVFAMQWLPVWHGLKVARAVLGEDMPRLDAAVKIVEKAEQALEQTVSGGLKNKLRSRLADSWRTLSGKPVPE